MRPQGNHPYGYTSFEYTLPATLLLAAPKPNLLAVRVNNTGRNSRWYSGSGIFRHTYLTLSPLVRFALWGLSVSTPSVQLEPACAPVPCASRATVQAECTLVNTGSNAITARVRVDLLSTAAAHTAAADSVNDPPAVDDPPTAFAYLNVSIGANATATAAVNISLRSPQLWSPDTPYLYRAVATIIDPSVDPVIATVEASKGSRAGEASRGPLASRGPAEEKQAEGVGQVEGVGQTEPSQQPRHHPAPHQHEHYELPPGPHTTSTTFGVRQISFDSVSGFLINGRATKLYGGCLHHDNGPLGAAAIDRAEERRVQILKAQGYNAIRTSHNPVSPAFLDACDREGMLVMDEAFDCWERGKNTDDYHLWFDGWWRRDVASMMLRDRNHPSIILWSIGNEIPMRDSPAGYNLSAALAAYVRHLDGGSRGVSTGRAITSAVPFVSDRDDKFMAPLDVAVRATA